MVADPGIAPHPALAVAEDPALAAVRQITAGLNNAPMSYGPAVPARPPATERSDTTVEPP
jgi:hypothetical protein